MTSTAAKILEQASQLPAREKLELVDRLIAELDLPDPTIEELGAEEGVRRSQAIKRGEIDDQARGRGTAQIPSMIPCALSSSAERELDEVVGW